MSVFGALAQNVSVDVLGAFVTGLFPALGTEFLGPLGGSVTGETLSVPARRLAVIGALGVFADNNVTNTLAVLLFPTRRAEFFSPAFSRVAGILAGLAVLGAFAQFPSLLGTTALFFTFFPSLRAERFFEPVGALTRFASIFTVFKIGRAHV